MREEVNIDKSESIQNIAKAQLALQKEIKDILNPDLIILQFCSNDFYNNSYEWESSGITRNQYVRRPYLVNNKIYYHRCYTQSFDKSSWQRFHHS